MRREESDLSELEMQLMMDTNGHGLRKWLSDSKNLSYHIRFAED